MKPPKRIVIGPHTYRVVADIDGLLSAAPCVGSCNADRQVIAYAPEQSDGALADTLMHEAVHGILSVLQIAPEHAEEDICQIMGPALVGLIRDNPKLVEFVRATG